MKTRTERMATPVEQMGRVDIRSYIKRRLAEENITAYQLAKILGVEYNNLIVGLNGKITVPLERIEKILWLLDGDDFLK